MHTYYKFEKNGTVEYIVYFISGYSDSYNEVRKFDEEIHAIAFVNFLNGGSAELWDLVKVLVR